MAAINFSSLQIKKYFTMGKTKFQLLSARQSRVMNIYKDRTRSVNCR